MREAQVLAFGPLLFQAARLLRDRGVLDELIRRGGHGATSVHIAETTGLSKYAATVLLEAGLAARLVDQVGEAFVATRVGYLFARDPLTRANVDFVGDVCFRASEHLGASLDDGEPRGLVELGPWSTVYEGLSELGEPARSSWFSFDHYYSDDTFPLVVPSLLASHPKKVLDVGANTGKFALQMLSTDGDVELSCVDLPGQLALCKKNIEERGYGDRAHYYPVDVRSDELVLPDGHDIIWMSQFLTCFGEERVVGVLSAAARALGGAARLFILETLWDQQPTEAGKVCLLGTSLYFTCVASGQSRMYDWPTLERMATSAGLRVVSVRHGIGLGHSLVECARAE